MLRRNTYGGSNPLLCAKRVVFVQKTVLFFFLKNSLTPQLTPLLHSLRFAPYKSGATLRDAAGIGGRVHSLPPTAPTPHPVKADRRSLIMPPGDPMRIRLRARAEYPPPLGEVLSSATCVFRCSSPSRPSSAPCIPSHTTRGRLPALSGAGMPSTCICIAPRRRCVHVIFMASGDALTLSHLYTALRHGGPIFIY